MLVDRPRQLRTAIKPFLKPQEGNQSLATHCFGGGGRVRWIAFVARLQSLALAMRFVAEAHVLPVDWPQLSRCPKRT